MFVSRSIISINIMSKVRTLIQISGQIHFWESGGRIGNLVFSKPFTLGHECAGEVLRVGDGVTALREGARVAIKPGSSCKR